FHDCHSDVLQTHWSKSLDTQHPHALNPDVKQAWFELFKKHIVDNQISPEHIYGMDESGFTPSHGGKERVYGHQGTKTQHKQGGANHENVTALATICADGSFLHPMLIYKGKNFMTKWSNNNVACAIICHSPNGWTDGELAQNWIEQDFDPQTWENVMLEANSLQATQEISWR
ncbi:hypothetical protein P691DRAFT_689709, partial [Macrolepiota fuliginosa MF-IS2]